MSFHERHPGIADLLSIRGCEAFQSIEITIKISGNVTSLAFATRRWLIVYGRALVIRTFGTSD
jgi:hypothetical protein